MVESLVTLSHWQARSWPNLNFRTGPSEWTSQNSSFQPSRRDSWRLLTEVRGAAVCVCVCVCVCMRAHSAYSLSPFLYLSPSSTSMYVACRTPVKSICTLILICWPRPFLVLGRKCRSFNQERFVLKFLPLLIHCHHAEVQGRRCFHSLYCTAASNLYNVCKGFCKFMY